ncbi:Polyisoprenyl-teichoic acid--peptidoglycan teichoic acid transferase TagU [Paenibacillus plantiphilus]|uniref:Polyisoprenyl-teichoic acid--peptidoglycan teichoic acid transferase TagU n=1 Tax=Paenibacillus plantiphilus TaxID=2905650 RepID=A0ABN8GQU5_9BACL|nr:LCP family protein [Paenibacillus plantiphilus]CAH1213938.1 Polyisoprenyl-teichoic acid--peptidoglycan teichoic acid transferase TagU [Paenibacillus plantiphilus]
MSNKSSLPPRSASRGAKGSSGSKPPKKPARWFRRFMFLLLLILIGIAAYLGYLYKESKEAIQVITSDADPTIVIPEDQSVKVKGVTFLLMGIDTRKETGSLNTDVMMIASFNPNTKSATIVSIPRDSKIELDGYKSRKANAYYANFLSSAKNDGLKNKEAEQKAKQDLRKMFGKYFDIPIDYTATINFQGFVDIVDAVGGVEVDVDMNMRYVDNADGTNINLTKGRHTLHGDDALDFVRYRKSNDGNNMSSDFDRNKRQSQVIAAITDELKSVSSVTNIFSVLEAVGNNMRMDIPASEVENMMFTYFRMGRSDITFIPLEGKWRSPYVRLEEDKLQAAKAALQAKLAE